MSGKVEFTPEALLEIDEAFGRYLDEGSRQVAEAFVREVDRAVALIASSPTIWPRFDAGTRRYVLRKFPYNIVYIDRETTVGIEVVAVAHHKRRPRYWIKRLRRGGMGLR